MVRNHEDLEGFLSRLERRFEKVESGTYLVAVGANQPPVVLRLAPPVLVAQVEIGKVPSGGAAREAPFLRRLLELNATDLFHAAYGIEGDRVVLSAALELDSLDLNELEAVLADVDMAIANHVPGLRQMVDAQASG
jgi:hypothetical protein